MAEHHPNHVSIPASHDGRFGEHFDEEIPTRSVLVTTAILGGICVLAMLLMWGMKRWVEDDIQAKDPPASPLVDMKLHQRAVADRMPQGVPVLQPSPEAELVEMRRAQAQELHGYGWIDEGAGIVRVPIEIAMDLVLAKGLPARPPSPVAVPLVPPAAANGAAPAGEERTHE